METQETQETQQMYELESVESAPKPTLVCVGTVGEVEEGYLSPKSEKYIVQPISIDALEGGRNTKVFLLYRPEWFVKGFKPKTLEDVDGRGKGLHWVYANHIRNDDKMSFLRGLTGSNEAFKILMNDLVSLPLDEETQLPLISDITGIFQEFFSSNIDSTGQPVKIGYVLEQQRAKTGEVDDNGKDIYRLENRYQVKSFFDPTTKNLKSWENRIAKSEGRFLLCYTGGPF